MNGESEVLPDTTIKVTRYKRIKFAKLKPRQTNGFNIGYLHCDNKGSLFSFEKNYSKKVNCSMTIHEEYKIGASKPFAFTELDFLADTLSQKELNIFNS